MITLYHCVAARSFRPLWMMEEQRLSYDLKILPFPPRALAKDYKAINPLGTVPYLIDGETRMTKSAAICQYLGTRHGPSPLVVDVDEPAYGAFLNWLHFGEATLTFPQTLVLRYGRLEPPGGAVNKLPPTIPSGFLAGSKRSKPHWTRRRHFAPIASPRPTSRSATRCVLPKISASPSISART